MCNINALYTVADQGRISDEPLREYMVVAFKSVSTVPREAEIQLLLEAIYLKYGYDFRGYAEASLKRRIWRNLAFSGYRNIAELRGHVLNDKACFEKLLMDLSIHVTDMFRDPGFFQAFRNHVIPCLRKLPFIKVWHAGCASGEEVYSMAILFHEEGLDRKTRVYAFDRQLQNRVFCLFNDSLGAAGYLCLGTRESLRYSSCSDHFENIVPKEKIYRKIKGLPA